MDWLFPTLFFAFFVYVVYSMLTKKGRGKMFGGEIEHTLNSVIEREDGLGSSLIKVHLIKPKYRPEDRDIGIEITSKSKFHWKMIPITLTKDQAKDLSRLLNEAIESDVKGT